MEECTAVPISSPAEENETVRLSQDHRETNRRQTQKFMVALIGSGFAGLGRRQGKSVRVCWAGNRHILYSYMHIRGGFLIT
jgi:hypothetical protein